MPALKAMLPLFIPAPEQFLSVEERSPVVVLTEQLFPLDRGISMIEPLTPTSSRSKTRQYALTPQPHPRTESKESWYSNPVE